MLKTSTVVAVALPVLLAFRVGADDAAEAALDATRSRSGPADALGRVDPRHADAERVAERDERDGVDDDLAMPWPVT